MKILFIGPYRQQDGWGIAAEQYIRALTLVTPDLAIRPIYMGTSVRDCPEDLKEYEARQYDHYDVVIQNVLPNLFNYTNDATKKEAQNSKHIGLFYLETSDFEHASWPAYMRLMDDIWVSSEFEEQALYDVGVSANVVKMPIDVTKYDKEYQKMEIGEMSQDDFVFYFVGEYTPRKNIPAILTAYYREFSPLEPVHLVLKLNKSGYDSENLLKQVLVDIEQHKNLMGMYQNLNHYPKVHLLTEFLPNDVLCSLHQSFDCFVSASYGEACCIPAMDALGFGSAPVFNYNTGVSEFVTLGTGYGVTGRKTPVMTPEKPIPEMYTARSSWYEVNPIELGSQMRLAYLRVGNRGPLGKKSIQKHSYENIAQRIKEVL